jgi:2-methylisocitrate lyase-like PEP mutase family enzyme
MKRTTSVSLDSFGRVIELKQNDTVMPIRTVAEARRIAAELVVAADTMSKQIRSSDQAIERAEAMP